MICSIPRSAICVISMLCVQLLAGASAQSPAKSQNQTDIVKVFHPTGPPLSYDVATIKPADPKQPYAGTTLRNYIARAYGVPLPWGMPVSESESSQVIGGPSWLDQDKYVIKGQPTDDLRQAMQSMTREQRLSQDEAMEQALLADRFKLKVHFETRDMRVFDLVPAKGGLKIVAVDPPPAAPMTMPPKPVVSVQRGSMPPGMMSASVSFNGLNILNARSTTLQSLCNALRGQAPEIAGRPIVDKSGFTGYFDVTDFRFIGTPLPQQGDHVASSDPDAPSLSTALNEKLGLKLVAAHAQVEVVVIDSIERPSEN